jgi:DNA-binding response OmpR family regulator
MTKEDIRVVVVDDDADAASVLKDMLEMDGYQVHVAHDGAQALALVAEHRPDGVLLDLGLPDVDGLEVARRLRDQEGPQLVIVAVTGRSSEDDRRDADAAGIDYMMVKPVDMQLLARIFPPVA